MKRLFAVLLVLVAARAAEKEIFSPIVSEQLFSPAAPGALGAALTNAPDGTVWFSWVEPTAGKDGANTLRFSTLDPVAKMWGAARTIARDASVTTNTMDFPQLAVGPGGHAVALWTDGHGGARFSESRDAGATWSAPAPVTRESDEVEKFSLAVLADGRVLVAWLDARAIKKGGKMTALYARILGDKAADALVDPSVCDCCQTTLAAFLDGGALVAFRARTEQEQRDIRTARFDGRSWDESRPLNNDDWRIAGCPVNGPRLAADGGRVAAAWFTAADNDPRVLASFSPDAGTRFLMPLRVDRGHPAGHVDTLILRDGALLVTWLENDGSVWLRRVSPDFTADAPFALAPAGTVGTKHFPRVALVKNYAGGSGGAEFVAVFSRDEKSPALQTLLVTVPEGALLSAAQNCDCSPTPEQLAGFSMRGTIAAIATERGALRVSHDEIPGVLAAGTHEFRAAPGVLAAVAAGRQFFGRIERRDGAWWVFDVRLAVAPRENK